MLVLQEHAPDIEMLLSVVEQRRNVQSLERLIPLIRS